MHEQSRKYIKNAPQMALRLGKIDLGISRGEKRINKVTTTHIYWNSAGIPSLSNFHCFQHSSVLQLTQDNVGIEVHRGLGVERETNKLEAEHMTVCLEELTRGNNLRNITSPIVTASLTRWVHKNAGEPGELLRNVKTGWKQTFYVTVNGLKIIHKSSI